jgi:ankyrin repeat protein
MKGLLNIFGPTKKKDNNSPLVIQPQDSSTKRDGSFTARALTFMGLNTPKTTRSRSHTVTNEDTKRGVTIPEKPVDKKDKLEIKKVASVKTVDNLQPNSARGPMSTRKPKSNIQTFSLNTSREHTPQTEKNTVSDILEPNPTILKKSDSMRVPKVKPLPLVSTESDPSSKLEKLDGSKTKRDRKEEPIIIKTEKRKSIFQALLEKAIGQQTTIESAIEKSEDGADVEDDHRMDHLNENAIINNDDPVSVLHRASLIGDLQKLKKILKSKEAAELINTQDKDGSYALHKAASKNKYQAIKLLLDAGAKVDVLDKVSSTPLHWACAAGHLESTQMLCKYNAQVNIRDKYGYSPLHLCLRKKGYKCSDFLLLMGADINYKREDGATALHVACDKGDFITVSYLCGKPKIIVNRRDKFGDTPIMTAAGKGHLKIVEFLMKKDIQSCRIRNEKNENLLHKACDEGHKQVVFLVANLSPILCSQLMNEADIYGRTPLHHSVKAQQFQIVKTLLTMGAEMDTQDNSGNTALHYAIKENDPKIVKFLVQSGCKTDLKNKNNETPKQLAKKMDIELNL